MTRLSGTLLPPSSDSGKGQNDDMADSAVKVTLDHCVVHVSDWERSNAFYRDRARCRGGAGRRGFAYRFGAAQLNLHGPGVAPTPVARLPVPPGGSDLCFEWPGPHRRGASATSSAAASRSSSGRSSASAPKAAARSVYFRDPDGSLLEFISYAPA